VDGEDLVTQSIKIDRNGIYLDGNIYIYNNAGNRIQIGYPQ